MDKNNQQQATDMRQGGFTLIEVMVTVALLAVLLASVAALCTFMMVMRRELGRVVSH